MAEKEPELSADEQEAIVALLMLGNNWPPPPSNNDVDEGSSASSNHIHIVGSMLANVLVYQSYKGNIQLREKVNFVRGDKTLSRNSIKAFDARMEYMGSVECFAAAALSPLIDDKLITISGFVERTMEGFQILCRVLICARAAECERVQLAIRRSGLIISESNILVRVEGKIVKKFREIFKLLDLKVCSERTVEALEPPRNMIKTELFPHQKEGLGWLVSRENSCKLPLFWEEENGFYVNELTHCKISKRPKPVRGGIFADDMGLGKTLTLLSLIAFDKWVCSGDPSGNVDAEINEERGEENSVPFGKMSKGRGSRRVSKEKQKVEYLDANRMGGPPFAFDKPCDFLEPNATLIVSSSIVYSTWLQQLEEHTRPGCFEVYGFYEKRTESAEELQKYDIVVTTYGTLASEFNVGTSPILKIEWRRVILDEAHVIKNPEANQSKAIAELKAQCRWIVTGMPIQYNTSHLFSLMAFLKIEPFFNQKHWFNWALRPLSKEDGKGMSWLQVLLESITLRRTKEKCLVSLPSKSIETYPVILNKEEREAYDQLEAYARQVVQESASDDSNITKNYASMPSFLTRLLQTFTSLAQCPSDLRDLLPPSEIEDVKNNPELLKKLLKVLKEGVHINVCPICLSPPGNIVITCCEHHFCRPCILRSIKQSNSLCPMCRRPLSLSDLYGQRPVPPKIAPIRGLSSKVAALLLFLSASRDASPTTKSVIFSQFGSVLIFLEEPLKQAGFKFIRIDGSTTAKTRGNMIKKFGVPAPEGPTVLLASVRAWSGGINLTAASRVYLMEPSLDPAVEEQAVDRVHRIGQKEDVKVVRFFATNTIDERILQVQERKKLLPTEASGHIRPKDRKDNTREDFWFLLNM